MIARTLTAIGAVFVLFGGWMLIQQAGRRFARRHPEFGRFREEGGECGRTCGCANWKTCARKRSEGRGQRTDASYDVADVPERGPEFVDRKRHPNGRAPDL